LSVDESELDPPIVEQNVQLCLFACELLGGVPDRNQVGEINLEENGFLSRQVLQVQNGSFGLLLTSGSDIDTSVVL
jgi:hypothetical protein